MKNIRNGGYIVVETVGSFLVFVMLVISILSLVNIAVVQARVHYALTQSAETLSMYSYILEVTGIADWKTTLAENVDKTDSKVSKAVGNLNQVLSGLQGLSSGDFDNLKKNIDTTVDGAKGVYDQGKQIVDSIKNDPKGALQSMAQYALDKGINYAFGELVRPLVGMYLSNGDMDGDAYLRVARVKGGLSGLQFSAWPVTWTGKELQAGAATSEFLDAEDDIQIVVRYDIDYTFGALPLPFEPTLPVTQVVKTKAWLSGTDTPPPTKASDDTGGANDD